MTGAGDADRPGLAPSGQSLLSQVGALFAGQANQIINPKTLLPSMLRPGSAGQSLVTGDSGIAEWRDDALRTIGVLAVEACSYQGAGAAADTYVLNADSTMSAPAACANARFFRYYDAHWELPDGRLPKFRLLSAITPNATGPGGTHTCYLSRLASLGGGAGAISVTFTASPPITNAHGAVLASTGNVVKSDAVSLLDGETYMLTYANSAATAASSYINVYSRLYAIYE